MEVDDPPSSPPQKRARTSHAGPSRSTSAKPAPPKAQQSIFAPFRALGLITNHIPFAVQLRAYKGAVDGPRLHILTCIGRSWLLWEGGKMRLLFVGQEAGCDISAVAFDEADGDHAWAAAGANLIRYYRGKEVREIVPTDCWSNG
jgi:U3 small nucleolar RNA-associated protein 21